MANAKILAFAGSARRDSFNKKLVKVAARGAEQAGAEVTVIDLADYPLPIYDGDLEEQGFPENVGKLRELFKAHDGLLLACPEYNSSITPLLKNTIDWVSRPEGDDPGLVAFQGKTAALLAASPGGLGGLRGLVSVRSILGNIGVVVLPKQHALSKAHEAFSGEELSDDGQRGAVEGIGAELANFLQRVGG